MIETTPEMKELAKSAATAYITGLRLNDMKESIDSFLDAYNYAIKKIWLREHKNAALKDLASNPTEYEDKN